MGKCKGGKERIISDSSVNGLMKEMARRGRFFIVERVQLNGGSLGRE
jgi:hypothetical protein